ncbi:MAG: 6,7-dimethyl-8-ribityllumazine synthase, partial [Acidobacteriaceae bacterium]
ALYHRTMIKGLTVIRVARTAADFDRLAGFFAALGLEPLKGWADGESRGAPFGAPLGNLEFVLGKLPSGPEILVEVTGLDGVRDVAARWAAQENSSIQLSPVSATHWNSRIFTAEPAPGIVVGFWESDNPHHGKPVAIEGDLSAAGMRFGVIAARWNAVITDRLLQGALDALLRSGAKRDEITVVRVPGAWEIPAAARLLAESARVDAVVTLGVLLRGETAHYEAIYNEVSRGIGQSQQDTGVPHSFGVLTCETLEQALDRAGLKSGNKGFEAAMAAIEMVDVKRKIATAAVTNIAADR